MSVKSRFLAATLLILFPLSRPAIGATIGFKPAQNYPVGTNPVAVAAGDFNGDGNRDLAVANSGNSDAGDDGSVSILLGKGDGTLQPATNLSAGKNPASIAAADFNGDERLDLVVSNANSANVSVLLGNGDGTFQAHADYAVLGSPSTVGVGDFNADGRLDFVVANSGKVSVLLGNGDGTFQPRVDWETGLRSALAVADFDLDGKADLAVAHGASVSPLVAASTYILRSNGDGTFQLAAKYTNGPAGLFGCNSTEYITAADLNLDAKPDLIRRVHCLLSLFGPPFEREDLLIGNGDGTFEVHTDALVTELSSVRTPVAADFDGDQKPDVGLMAAQSSSTEEAGLFVFLGNGDGMFQSPISLGTGFGTDLRLAADFNGDKAPDLVAVELPSNNSISVLIHTGTEFSISALAPTPQTISRGQAARSTVTVSLLNGFDNPVALACSVQPAQAGSPTCSINPGSVTPPPNGTATATLTINTGTATASRVPPLPLRDSRPPKFLWLPVAGFALMGAGLGCGGARRRRLLNFLASGIILVGLILQTSCGGGTSNSISDPPPSQTYTVTVTGTSGSTQHSTMVTLKVQ